MYIKIILIWVRRLLPNYSQSDSIKQIKVISKYKNKILSASESVYRISISDDSLRCCNYCSYMACAYPSRHLLYLSIVALLFLTNTACTPESVIVTDYRLCFGLGRFIKLVRTPLALRNLSLLLTTACASASVASYIRRRSLTSGPGSFRYRYITSRTSVTDCGKEGQS